MSKSDIPLNERIIVALDSPNFGHAFSLVIGLRDKIKTFKVGPILFLSNGPNGIEQLNDQAVDIFLDLKFHDIPSTIEKTIEHIVRNRIKMFTMHSLGGFDMMSSVCKRVKKEAKDQKKEKPLVLAVTVLTSHTDESIKEIGINRTTTNQVLKLASLADKAGVDGIVCSGHEIKLLKDEFGDRFKYVVPGIRPYKRSQDQKRVVTPLEAIQNGADYIVVGRPITESRKPSTVVDQIIDSLNS